MSNVALISLCLVVGLGLTAAIFVIWLSRSLLRGWSGDCFDNVPGHKRALEQAIHQYEIAEELGYPAEVLAGLESQVCAARQAAEEADTAKAARQAAEARRQNGFRALPAPARAQNVFAERTVVSSKRVISLLVTLLVSTGFLMLAMRGFV